MIKPFVGKNRDVQSDATVTMIEQLSTEGVVLSGGILPRYSDIDTYWMTASIIDLAICKIIAVGGKLGHIAGLDNFCWPDPVQSEKTPDGEYKLAQLVRANQALYDFTKLFKVPCISGKDSMKNDSTRGGRKISIPPSILFSAISKMNDIRKAVTLDYKQAGDLIYVIGDTKNETGGSEYFAMLNATGNNVPKLDAAQAIKTYEKVSALTEAELVHSLHTPALGGLAVGFAKSSIAGCLGAEIDLNKLPVTGNVSTLEALFSETNCRFIATVSAVNKEAFEAMLGDVAFAEVGKVTADEVLKIKTLEGETLEIAVNDLRKSYKSTLDHI